MKKILLVLISAMAFLASAQEYQFSGEINGREATLLLHFVTASDDPNEVWSHGSFYFNDDEQVNIIYQYKPKRPESGLLTFNLIPNSVGRLDYIKGNLTKESFTGVYAVKGKETPFTFKAKKNHEFIIYNYYQNKVKNGKQRKYFGKFICQNDKEIAYQLTQYLSKTNKKRMPRPYLKDVYENVVEVEMDKRSDASWLVNYAIFPIISTPDKVVYQVIKNARKDGETILNEKDQFTYDVKNRKIIE